MDLLKKVWTTTWKISVFVLLWGLLYAPAVLILSPETRSTGAPIGPRTRLFLELLGAVAVVVAAWAAARFLDRRSFSSLGFASKGVLRDVTAGLALGAGMIALAVATLALAGWAELHPAPAFSWRILAVMGTALLFNSATQEVLVRGYMLQTLESQFNTPVALVGSSLLFVLLHAGVLVDGGVLPAVNLLGAGLLLGLAYTTTRNLWLPIALHFSWNFLQGPLLGIAVSAQALGGGWEMVRMTGPTLATGGSFGLEGGLVATIVTACGIAAVLATGRLRIEPKR